MSMKLRLGNGRHLHLPRSRIVRIIIGVVLIAGGLLGFMPVLGFWMIPLGLLVLSVDLPFVRRWRRKLEIRWGRRRGAEAGQDAGETRRNDAGPV